MNPIDTAADLDDLHPPRRDGDPAAAPAAGWRARARQHLASRRPHRSERERWCRRLVQRQALKAAGMSALPVPGVDLFVNGQLLAQTIETINRQYGLSAGEIAALPTPMRDQVDDMVQRVGGFLIGRVVSQAALMTLARTLGLRLGAQQAAKLAPVAGMAASAAISGWLFQRLCLRHIEQCEQVRAALPELPPPPPVGLLPAPMTTRAGTPPDPSPSLT